MLNEAVNPGLRALVVGGGYTGLRFAQALAAQGATVALTRRALPEPPAPAGTLRWLALDSREAVVPEPGSLEGITHVLVTTPPDGSPGDGVLQALAPLLADLPLQWVG